MALVVSPYRFPSRTVLSSKNEFDTQHFKPFNDSKCRVNTSCPVQITAQKHRNGSSGRKKSKNLLYPRRAKTPPEPGINRFQRKNPANERHRNFPDSNSQEDEIQQSENSDDDSWSPDQLEAISSLFQRRIPQKPGKLGRERPLPLPTPYKIRPLGFPTPKKHVRSTSPATFSSRLSLSSRIYKNPNFLIDLAREIRDLPAEKNASEVLNKWCKFLRKGSLSLTIRELGHMGLPDKALETFCWAQRFPQFFPDDRILASTVEILARTRGLKMPFDVNKLVSSASKSVIEATSRGFIRAGQCNLARKILLAAKDNQRTLDSSIHAKLVAELGKNPDKYRLASAVLDELGNRDDLKLKQQDCTSVMKMCIKLGKFEVVESLFSWFKQSGQNPSVVMYTTLIYSRYKSQKHREALAAVWEMEELNYLLDLPAYRVVISLCVALNDISRAVRYFSRLKDAGFSPTYDIYRDLIKLYAASGRLAKCKQISKEMELVGFKLDKQTASLLLQMKEGKIPATNSATVSDLQELPVSPEI